MSEESEGVSSGDDVVKVALAAGHTYREAGELGGVSERTVRRRMSDPQFAAEVSQVRSAYVNTVTGKLLASAEQAVEVIVDSLRAEKQSDRLRAAELMLTLVRRFHADTDVDARLAALEAAVAPEAGGAA